MKHTIFLRDGELWLINGEVPERPVRDIYRFDANIREAETRYEEIITRLKSEAIRVGNEFKYGRRLYWHEDHYVLLQIAEGEFYKIDAEVEYYPINPCIPKGKCSYDEQCKQVCRDIYPVAILSPVKQEDDQDALWIEIKNKIAGDKGRHVPWSETTQTLKSKFHITRKPS